MIPILYSPTATVFNTNGLGRLSDCISCIVTEERNGQYTLEMIYPVDGVHFEDISYSSIIKAIPSDGATAQLFRVYKISKPLNGRVIIEADHISYQLSFIPVAPFNAGTCAAALEGLVTNSLESNPFTVWTDKSTSASYTQNAPASFRSRLGGVQGSILDTFGGEFEFDNYTVKLHANRGADNGVVLRYGKNITDIKQEENISNTITGIVPYWTKDSVTITGDAQYADSASSFPFKRTVVKDFSQDIETQPTKEELEAYTRNYINSNNIGIPSVNIDVSFIALWQTEEYERYANLERVKLCDTVTVEFEKLGISAKAKVIKTEYDVLKERYLHIEVGEARSTLATTINNIEKKTEESIDYSDLTSAINRATELLRGGLGGHVVINTNSDGEPNEILIMDTADIGTAQNIIRMNVNGIGFSTTGYNGTFNNAWTIDGVLNADFIRSGTINGILIKGSTIQFGDNNLTATMAYQPTPSFIGENALSITGNTRVAIESTEYQARMTGYSAHIGSRYYDEATETYKEPSYLLNYMDDDTHEGYVTIRATKEIYGNSEDRVQLKGTNEISLETDSAGKVELKIPNAQGYQSGYYGKKDKTGIYVATSDGYLEGVTVTEEETKISNDINYTGSVDSIKGIVGAVTDGLKLQVYGGNLYVYVGGSMVGSVNLS